MSNRPLSRRAFQSSLLAALLVLRARPSSKEARVKIDTERVIGPIDPKLYGNFTEHLGRCIEGGIFEENSRLSDAKGFRKDVLRAVDDLHVSLLRWPGGNFSSNYNWRDGIGPRDDRPARLEMAWGTIEDTASALTSFSSIAKPAKPNRICALTSVRVPGTKRRSGSSIATCPATRRPLNSARRMGVRSLGKYSIGGSAMRWMGPGKWATARPTITASSPWKGPS